MQQLGRGGWVVVVCLLAAARTHAQGMNMAPSMAPGPGAAAASPTPAPGVAPLPPTPTEAEQAPAARATATTPASEPAAAPATLAVNEPEVPERPRRFGDRGVFVISDSLDAHVGFLGYTKNSVGSASFGLSPALDYFVAQDVMLGASAFVRHSSSTNAQNVDTYGWSEGISVHVGRNFPLSDLFSVRPKLSLGVSHSKTTVEGVQPTPLGYYYGSSYSKETAVFLELYVPLLLHPAQHLFVGFGPDAYFDPYHSITNESGTVEHLRYFVGASSVIGGWF